MQILLSLIIVGHYRTSQEHKMVTVLLSKRRKKHSRGRTRLDEPMVRSYKILYISSDCSCERWGHVSSTRSSHDSPSTQRFWIRRMHIQLSDRAKHIVTRFVANRQHIGITPWPAPAGLLTYYFCTRCCIGFSILAHTLLPKVCSAAGRSGTAGFRIQTQ